MTLPKEILNILACPICKNKLNYAKNQLICTKCKKEYQIKNNIPILLKEELIKGIDR